MLPCSQFLDDRLGRVRQPWLGFLQFLNERAAYLLRLRTLSHHTILIYTPARRLCHRQPVSGPSPSPAAAFNTHAHAILCCARSPLSYTLCAPSVSSRWRAPTLCAPTCPPTRTSYAGYHLACRCHFLPSLIVCGFTLPCANIACASARFSIPPHYHTLHTPTLIINLTCASGSAFLSCSYKPLTWFAIGWL